MLSAQGRGAGAVERARLEIACSPNGEPWVRIPPSPLLYPLIYKGFSVCRFKIQHFFNTFFEFF